MKKLNFILPILMIGLFALVGSRMIGSGSISPVTMMGIGSLLLVFLLLSKPKASAAKPMAQIEEQIRGEFAKDAFADEPALGAKFQAALTDYSKNMPKAALNKLQKLAPQCTGDPEVYAVAMASAMIHTTLNKPMDADSGICDEFLAWAARFAEINNMSLTFTVSEDPANASEEMKKYL